MKNLTIEQAILYAQRIPNLECFFSPYTRFLMPSGEIELSLDRADDAFLRNAGGVPESPPSDGWFYWYCVPGCIPDSAPVGPFETERAALCDAIEQADLCLGCKSEDEPCEACCEHSDIDTDDFVCLICGKSMVEELSAQAYDRAKAMRQDGG